jgi:hypothetical protein
MRPSRRESRRPGTDEDTRAIPSSRDRSRRDRDAAAVTSDEVVAARVGDRQGQASARATMRRRSSRARFGEWLIDGWVERLSKATRDGSGRSARFVLPASRAAPAVAADTRRASRCSEALAGMHVLRPGQDLACSRRARAQMPCALWTTGPLMQKSSTGSAPRQPRRHAPSTHNAISKGSSGTYSGEIHVMPGSDADRS